MQKNPLPSPPQLEGQKVYQRCRCCIFHIFLLPQKYTDVQAATNFTQISPNTYPINALSIKTAVVIANT